MDERPSAKTMRRSPLFFLFHMEALADKTGKIELHTQKMALP